MQNVHTPSISIEPCHPCAEVADHVPNPAPRDAAVAGAVSATAPPTATTTATIAAVQATRRRCRRARRCSRSRCPLRVAGRCSGAWARRRRRLDVMFPHLFVPRRGPSLVSGRSRRRVRNGGRHSHRSRRSAPLDGRDRHLWTPVRIAAPAASCAGAKPERGAPPGEQGAGEREGGRRAPRRRRGWRAGRRRRSRCAGCPGGGGSARARRARGGSSRGAGRRRR
jgi:hypothetical protein